MFFVELEAMLFNDQEKLKKSQAETKKNIILIVASKTTYGN